MCENVCRNKRVFFFLKWYTKQDIIILLDLFSCVFVCVSIYISKGGKGMNFTEKDIWNEV